MFDIGGYTEALTISEAVTGLKENPNAMLIAGGTDVLIKTRERKEGYTGRDLIGITRIESLKNIWKNDDGIFIGACATFDEIEKNEVVNTYLPSLSIAVGTVGGPQVRAMGTIGGNICNGATSADSASTLFCFNASLLIEGLSGKKEIPIQDFYMGPGKVALTHGEILTAIRIKPEDYEGYKGQYIKFSNRNAMDIATLGCSVLVKERQGIIEDLRIAFGVAGPTPLRAHEAEAFAKGLRICDENLQAIGMLCLKNARARDSWRASKAFRENLIAELPGRAIRLAINWKVKT